MLINNRRHRVTYNVGTQIFMRQFHPFRVACGPRSVDNDEINDREDDGDDEINEYYNNDNYQQSTKEQ